MKQLKSTQIFFTIYTQSQGARIQQQRAEYTLLIPDRLERLWYSLVIIMVALMLTGDDLIGRAIYDARRNFDTMRLGLFILFAGVRLCFVEIAN